MLKLFFDALERDPWIYWLIAVPPTVALIGVVVSTIWKTRLVKNREWIFTLVVGIFLVAWRWPFFLEAREFNPDESQLIAGAATLARDPVFWRSVDGTTSGPLNFYALLPLHFLGLPLDYFTARLTGLLLVGVGLWSCYRLFRSFAPPAAAQLALLPAVVFFGTTGDENFLHYSSEHVSLALMGLASLGLWRMPVTERQERASLILGGIAVGLLPWAKLQAAPFSVVLIGGALWSIFRDSTRPRAIKWRSCRRLILFAALPSVVALIAIVATGQFEHFVRNYFLQNLVYVGDGTTFRSTIKKLLQFTSTTWAYPGFVAESLTILLLTTVLFWRVRRLPDFRFVTGMIIAVVAGVCVLAPRRPFPHYLLLTIFPLTYWLGAGIGQLWTGILRQRVYGLVVLAIGALLPLSLRFTQPIPEIVEGMADDWRRPHAQPGTVLRAYSKPGDFLGVWGWRTDVYVDARLIQATRDPHSVWSITPNPYRDYYRARYLADLRRSAPKVFVDSVGPGAFGYSDRAADGHESFPALASHISENFGLLVDLGAARIYLRRDPEHPSIEMLSGAKLQEFISRSRINPDKDAPPPDHLEPANASGWNIDGRGVRTLQPEGRMTWKLKGDERQISIEYGFHPRAYTEGRTNGAEFVVELHRDDSSPRPIFRRLVDPMNKPADRELLETRLTLPPFTSGTRLVMRTEAGAYNDAAWDWLYVGRIRIMRSPVFLPEQFPEFHRLPDHVDANQSRYREQNGRDSLELNAPATLTYSLEGTERRLSFSYGIQPEPLPPPDGATFHVELHRANRTIETLFEHTLRPRSVIADRDRHRRQLAIPRAQARDRIVLRITSDTTESGRSAYVTDLLFE